MSMTQFEEGVLYAASIVIAMHDEPTMAATILREAGLANADCNDLDDYDKASLRKLREEPGIALRGL